MDAEKRLQLEISAAIASLRFFWPWVLVAGFAALEEEWLTNEIDPAW